jgi:2-polyprenyl-3-methyl-5-hydroxy-6-metoxy-1,4-benzoquinol methylase
MWKTIASRFEVNPTSKPAKACGDDDLLAGRKPLQMGWYRLASSLVEGQTVLDVGCGSGEGLKLLAARARKAVGIDLDERMKREDLNVEIKSLSEVPDKSTDVSVCVDVIEHVEDDLGFIQQLIRVSRKLVFVSTPNYTASRNTWPYHVREYTPRQFERLFSPYGTVQIFGGDSSGEIVCEISAKSEYYFLNDLYCRPDTIWPARILRRILRARVWPHQAATISINENAR